MSTLVERIDREMHGVSREYADLRGQLLFEARAAITRLEGERERQDAQFIEVRGRLLDTIESGIDGREKAKARAEGADMSRSEDKWLGDYEVPDRDRPVILLIAVLTLSNNVERMTDPFTRRIALNEMQAGIQAARSEMEAYAEAVMFRKVGDEEDGTTT